MSRSAVVGPASSATQAIAPAISAQPSNQFFELFGLGAGQPITDDNSSQPVFDYIANSRGRGESSGPSAGSVGAIKNHSMSTFIALLRAINVGGTGKLPMTDLSRLCSKAGFTNVQTYIASGNVVFDSDRSAPEVKAALEASLKRYAGKPIGVVVRTALEMAAVLEANPFREAPPNRAVAIFLDAPPPRDALGRISGQTDEKVALGRREIYVWYGEGMGRSKLRIPAAAQGTARNMNTVAKLTAMARRF
jgi:uncharacterized protein (DUF1697 family)